MSFAKPSSPASALSSLALQRAPQLANDDEEWVTLTTYPTTAQAEVMRGVLEQAQIPVRVTDGHTESMTGIPTLALGGVGLEVPVGELSLAQSLIRESGHRPSGVVFRVVNRFAVFSWSGAMALVSAVLVSTAARGGLFPARYESVAIVGSALVGMLLGRARVRFMCSNLKCGAPLLAMTTECPRCGGKVAGTIRSLNERLEAEELLRGAARKPELE